MFLYSNTLLRGRLKVQKFGKIGTEVVDCIVVGIICFAYVKQDNLPPSLMRVYGIMINEVIFNDLEISRHGKGYFFYLSR